MTRQELMTEYNIDAHGIIHSPGKFEGQMIYSPYFWDAYLNGMADSDDGEVLTFYVTDDDLAQFPELAGVKAIDLISTDQGFVVCTAR